MATQAVKYLSVCLPVAVVWLLLVLNLFPFCTGAPQHKTAVLVAPILFVIALGVYAVGSVVKGVVSFNDCPQAAKELSDEINAARADLRKRGFNFDAE